MKPFLLALTVSAFVVTQSARAQDPTISIPTEQSEAAAAEASATPAHETKKKSDATEKVAASKPKPSNSAEPAKKTSAAPAATEPSKKMGPEATVRDLENKWMASVAAHDATVAQQVLANDYAGVSSRGQIMNKGAVLAQIKRDKDTYASAKITKMDVRLFGNAAVVVGTSTENGKDSSGKEFKNVYRWTDTWVNRNGAWQCVASQSAQIPR